MSLLTQSTWPIASTVLTIWFRRQKVKVKPSIGVIGNMEIQVIQLLLFAIVVGLSHDGPLWMLYIELICNMCVSLKDIQLR